MIRALREVALLANEAFWSAVVWACNVTSRALPDPDKKKEG